MEKMYLLGYMLSRYPTPGPLGQRVRPWIVVPNHKRKKMDKTGQNRKTFTSLTSIC